MKKLTRRNVLRSACAACGLALLKPVADSILAKREAISDIRWHEDDCGVYWTAKLWLDGKYMGVTGNYYCVDEDNLRLEREVQELEMREEFELLDGETGVRTLDELPIGSVLELPDMDDFLVLNEYPDGQITTTFYATEMWKKARVVAPNGEQWRTLGWGEQGERWVRC